MQLKTNSPQPTLTSLLTDLLQVDTPTTTARLYVFLSCSNVEISISAGSRPQSLGKYVRVQWGRTHGCVLGHW